MKIAICDDEKEFLENIDYAIKTYMNEKGLDYNIDLYNSGKSIMELQNNIVLYDVVFLDINMPEISGLEVAEWIRTYSDDVNIVFITAIISYAIQGYKYNAVRYILKNERQLKASIYECMDAVIYRMKHMGIDKRIFISNQKEISVNKVMYIESSAHKVIFHIEGKESEDYVVKNKLNNIEKMLDDCKYMIRVHQSYIVNMMYVKKISGYRIYLKNGIEIGVPKPRYKEVKKAIMEFKAII